MQHAIIERLFIVKDFQIGEYQIQKAKTYE